MINIVLPKWATTVTPLSKYLAMALFILLPFIGFYFGLLVGENRHSTVLPTAQLVASPTVLPTLATGQETTYIFYICSPSFFVHCSETPDANGQPILKPKHIRGIDVISFDASMNDRTAELPVGTKVFLHFPTGEPTISVTPNKGVLEVPNNAISVGLGDIGVYKIVGSGTATITVTLRRL
jgi:hypothetical protein